MFDHLFQACMVDTLSPLKNWNVYCQGENSIPFISFVPWQLSLQPPAHRAFTVIASWLLGTGFHEFEKFPRRWKLPVVILYLLQGLKTSTIYVLIMHWFFLRTLTVYQADTWKLQYCYQKPALLSIACSEFENSSNTWYMLLVDTHRFF